MKKLNGSEAEEKVAKSLERKGATCKVDTKMEGATDILAKWGTRTTWRVQVKSTSIVNGIPHKPSKEEIRRIKISSTHNKQTAVVAFVYPRNKSYKIDFYSIKRGIKIVPPDKQKKKKTK